MAKIRARSVSKRAGQTGRGATAGRPRGAVRSGTKPRPKSGAGAPAGAKTDGKTGAKIGAGTRTKVRRKSARCPYRKLDEMVLAAFAHDVRTPLTGILGLVELLATSGLGEPERRWVAAIKDAAEHLAELTTLVLEGARTGAGRLRPRRETFDLARFVAAVTASLKARAEAKNLDCETVIAAGLPAHVVGDPTLLRTAIENLLANAVKFTEHGKVGLAVAATPLRGKLLLSFSVADSGVGMTAAETGRLFRPFAQANRDVALKFGGAGLGLVQVRRLARAMGGDVTATSAPSPPGRGSTFRLTVTVARADPRETARMPAGRQENPAACALHILCVEDNPHGRVVMNAILSELGHRVDFSSSGEAAIEALARSGQKAGDSGGDLSGHLGGYDAVLMDITLGGIDGFEATRRIRALLGAAARVPVIGISGGSGTAAGAAAAAAGMNACLEKPVSPRVLAETLAQVTGSAAVRHPIPG
jgi:two-component system, sensor histidine kinase